jgi:hypothetical protein
MTGFVASDYGERWAEAGGEIGRWLGEGRLRSFEDVAVGFETFPETLLRLFNGQNTGKLVLRVAAD